MHEWLTEDDRKFYITKTNLVGRDMTRYRKVIASTESLVR